MISTRSRLLCIAMAAAGLASALPAQFTGPTVQSDTSPLPPVAGMTIQGGGVTLDNAAFNSQLALQGRGLLKKTVYTLGVESWVRWNRVMLLANSQTYFPVRSPAVNYTTETSGQHGSLNLGIPVILAKKTLVYPMAGLGLSSTSVTLRRNGTVDFNSDFRDISSIRGRNIDIIGRRYQANFGIGADQVFSTSLVYITVGLRAGYMTPIGDTKWRSGPEDVIGAPQLGLKGGYVRLAVGGLLARRRYSAIPMVGSLLPFLSR